MLKNKNRASTAAMVLGLLMVSLALVARRFWAPPGGSGDFAVGLLFGIGIGLELFGIVSVARGSARPTG